MMKLTTAMLALALSACAKSANVAPPAAATPAQPSAEFLALDRKEKNLAIYDAFWQRMETDYYDWEVFTTDQWRERRAQWRENAARAENIFVLYHSVFPRLLQLMPESHVRVHWTSASADADAPAKYSSMDENTRRTLATLMFTLGPGFHSMEVQRGNSRRNLIAEVWPDTPAAEAGVQPGARLLQSTAYTDVAKGEVHWAVEFVPLDPSEARAWESGEQPDLPVAPESIVRAQFELRPFRYRQPVESRRLAGGAQYLRFNAFGDDAFMMPAYKAIDGATSAGLIVDLRWNTGGHAEQLQKLAGVLLGAGAHLADTFARSGPGKLIATGSSKRYSGPLIVLTGPSSASSSEVFSAAVQDRNRGKLIGRKTAGAVLAARTFPLPDGGAVSLPVTNIWRADGRRIEGVGVEPDIWILPTLEDVRAGRDPVLERALRELAAPAR